MMYSVRTDVGTVVTRVKGRSRGQEFDNQEQANKKLAEIDCTNLFLLFLLIFAIALVLVVASIAALGLGDLVLRVLSTAEVQVREQHHAHHSHFYTKDFKDFALLRGKDITLLADDCVGLKLNLAA